MFEGSHNTCDHVSEVSVLGGNNIDGNRADHNPLPPPRLCWAIGIEETKLHSDTFAWCYFLFTTTETKRDTCRHQIIDYYTTQDIIAAKTTTPTHRTRPPLRAFLQHTVSSKRKTLSGQVLGWQKVPYTPPTYWTMRSYSSITKIP